MGEVSKMEGECESSAKKSEENPTKKEKNKLKMPKVIKDMFAKKEKMTVTEVAETYNPVEEKEEEETVATEKGEEKIDEEQLAEKQEEEKEEKPSAEEKQE